MGGWGLVSFPSSGRGLVVFRIVLFPLSISKSRMRHNSRCWRDSLRACQRCPRDCSGVLAVTFLEGVQGLLSHVVCVYLGYITQVGAVVALAGCYETTAQVLLYSYTQKYCQAALYWPVLRISVPILCTDSIYFGCCYQYSGAGVQS